MKLSLFYLSVTLLLINCGCGVQKEVSEDEWRPNTRKLDLLLRRYCESSEWGNFVPTVHAFIEAMRNKDWGRTYYFRTASFRGTISKEAYVKRMHEVSAEWSLLGYEVLGVESHRTAPTEYVPTEDYRIRLVIKIFENPGKVENVTVVWWTHEDDGWKCEELGSSILLPYGSRLHGEDGTFHRESKSVLDAVGGTENKDNRD